MIDKAYLAEAFKRLDLLNEEDYNLSTNPSAIEDAVDMLDDEDTSIMSMDIIDTEADSEEELQDSYEGKVILDCCVCHSKIYKNKEDVFIDEEQDLANVGEECPFCYTNDGYFVIGQVAPFNNEEPEVEETEEEVIETEKPIEDEKEEIEECVDSDVDEIVESTNDVMTPDEAKKYWEQNHESDPVLSEYDNYDYWYKDSVANGYIKESIENVSIETEDDTMTMTTKEDGGVVIETAPKENENVESEEVVAPLEPEVEHEIEMNDLESEVNDEVDIPIDEFDEETFDELGESFLKSTYDNVNSYKTESIKEQDGNKLVIEGLITFNSGNTKKTNFIFEAKDVTKSGKVRFIGENCQLSRGKKAFTIAGKVNEGKFISESLNYNYRAKDVSGKSARMYGTVRTNK